MLVVESLLWKIEIIKEKQQNIKNSRDVIAYLCIVLVFIVIVPVFTDIAEKHVISDNVYTEKTRREKDMKKFINNILKDTKKSFQIYAESYTRIWR